MTVIAGAGGGSKKSTSRTPYEAPDSLQSRAMVSILDLVGEGVIGGLVEGGKSIFFDDTPLVDAGGSLNFPGVTWAERVGEQLQDPIVGFDSVETPYNVSIKVEHGIPVSRTITNPNATKVKVLVTLPALLNQNTSNGDVTGTSVSYQFSISTNNRPFVDQPVETITGKTRSRYQRAHEYDLPRVDDLGNPALTWTVKMTRTSANSPSNVSDETYFDSYVEVVESLLTYPNSAIYGLTFDSAQFNQIPARSYLVDGLLIKVPSNYNPVTKTYTGVWNGASFNLASSSNPAWILYDLLTNKRYGLGRYIKESQVDRAKLYAIGKYCDELVPDGFGGMEPRFAINTAIQTQAEAYRLVADICAVFRGMAFWSGSKIGFTQDSPTDPSMIYSPANVVDGIFTYTGNAKRDRHSVVLVSWTDPLENYKRVIEYVEDPELISKYGVRKLETIAFGCTSRGQANRVGHWILYTERYSEMVSFKAGIDSGLVLPGEVVRINDPWRVGARLSGRVISGTLNSVTLDAPVTLNTNEARIAIMMPDGSMSERGVTQGIGTHSTLNFSSPLENAPVAGAMFSIADDIEPMLARVVSIRQESNTEFSIAAVEHNPEKYLAIEQGLTLEPRPTSRITTRPGLVTNLVAVTEMAETNPGVFTARISTSWTAPSYATFYEIRWRRESENWNYASSVTPNYEIENCPAGNYTISIAAGNAIGSVGSPVTISHTVDSSAVAPNVQNLRLNPDFLSHDLPVAWDAVAGAQQYVVRILTPADAVIREEVTSLTSYNYNYSRNLSDGGPRRSLKISVKARTPIGESASWTTGSFSNAAPAAPVGVSVEAGPGQASISAIRPADQDLQGMIIWMSSDPTVPTTSGNVIYQGSDNAYLKTALQPGLQVYFKVAFYDAFGTSGLNVSSSIGATPTAGGGVVKVTALPANPAAINDELAVFLDVADPATRGLYGWDGTQWAFTRDGANLVANSVTADRMAVTNLSSISANLGTMTAGNFTLDATGWIRGGAASWVTGKGIWQGYHDGNYKWRVGTPGGAGAAWDGTNFTIYGPSGEVTLQSGGSIGGYGDWANLVGDLGPITTTNVGTLIPNAAIGNAQINGNLWSTNWNYAGGTGWLLDRAGNFYGNNIYARGDIEASSLKANTAMVGTLNINAGAVTIPVHVAVRSNVNLGASVVGKWYTVASAYVNPEGGSVSALGTISSLSWTTTGSSAASNSVPIRILSPAGAVIASAGTFGGDAGLIAFGKSVETGTYLLQAMSPSYAGWTFYAGYADLLLIGSKR